ncbi:MAG: hypothetical protein LBL94_08220 [Prevotellaceae bacterium]|jgi:hypothetical protein|nr:hypothetical protein [Prevotellaceae bacterium]
MPTAKSGYTLSVADSTLAGTPLLKGGEAGDTTISTEAGALLLVPQTVSGAKVEAIFWVGDDAIIRRFNMPMLMLEAENSYLYNLTIVDSDPPGVQKKVWDWGYTGAPETFAVPQDGTYRLEVWGCKHAASYGTSPTGGGYSAGTIYLKMGQTLYAYVGNGGTNIYTSTSFNGAGGGGDASRGSGGGASDFRMVGGEWSNAQSLNSRILVAGGAGGYRVYQRHGRLRGHRPCLNLRPARTGHR